MRTDEPTPLTWRTITRPSQVMLPTYVVMFTTVGLSFVFTDRDRLLLSPGLRYAQSLMDLYVWGAMFIASAIIMVIAFLSQSRMLFKYALNLSAILMAIWSVVLTAAAYNADSSPSGWSWPAFVMAACIASNLSLSGEKP